MAKVTTSLRAAHPVLAVFMLLLLASRGFGVEIQAQGLFKNAAVLMIDGKQRMLKVGKRSPEGVLLVEAGPKLAIVEINGRRQTLTLSRRITSNFAAVDKTEVAIPRDKANQYISYASINGKRVRVLVDTGATSVALSGKHARSLGIDYKKGTPGRVTTASGVALAYRVTLNSVDVGGVAVNSVAASVVEGDFPVMILLGMTYLEHVDMREQNGTLYLQARF